MDGEEKTCDLCFRSTQSQLPTKLCGSGFQTGNFKL
jgi:hypothetical protein